MERVGQNRKIYRAVLAFIFTISIPLASNSFATAAGSDDPRTPSFAKHGNSNRSL